MVVDINRSLGQATRSGNAGAFTATKCRFFKSKDGFKNKSKRNLKIRFILFFKWSET